MCGLSKVASGTLRGKKYRKLDVKEYAWKWGASPIFFCAVACVLSAQKKSAGQLVSDSKKNGITPITDFDANIQQLIIVF